MRKRKTKVARHVAAHLNTTDNDDDNGGRVMKRTLNITQNQQKKKYN